MTGDARPLRTIEGNFENQMAGVIAECENWKPVLAVVALPDEDKAAKSYRYCRKFAKELNERTKVVVEFADESYSTQAGRLMEGKKAGVDANAACVIATDWIAQSLNKA